MDDDGITCDIYKQTFKNSLACDSHKDTCSRIPKTLTDVASPYANKVN